MLVYLKLFIYQLETKNFFGALINFLNLPFTFRSISNQGEPLIFEHYINKGARIAKILCSNFTIKRCRNMPLPYFVALKDVVSHVSHV